MTDNRLPMQERLAAITRLAVELQTHIARQRVDADTITAGRALRDAFRAFEECFDWSRYDQVEQLHARIDDLEAERKRLLGELLAKRRAATEAGNRALEQLEGFAAFARRYQAERTDRHRHGYSVQFPQMKAEEMLEAMPGIVDELRTRLITLTAHQEDAA